MDKELKEFMENKMLQIKNMAEKLGYNTEILDIEQTEVPTVSITIAKNESGEDIDVICNLIPTELYDTPVLFLQFYIGISNVIPKEKEKLIDEFITKQNEVFLC